MPTAVPMMAASASGLSMTRWEPNVRCKSSVTRKTPPSTPTSSPRKSTSASSSIAWKRARVSALTMFSLGIASAPRQPLATHRRGARRRHRRLAGARRGGRLTRGHLLSLGLEVRRKLGVYVIEHRERIGGRHRLEATHRLGDLLVDPLLEGCLEEIPFFQIRAETGQRVLVFPHPGLF